MKTKRMAGMGLRALGMILLLGPAGLNMAASPPERINFQGVLRDAAGAAVDGAQAMTFRLYDTSAGCPGSGMLLLTDDHNSVSVSGGLFNVALGDGTVTPGTANSLAETFRDNAEVWVEIEVSGDGGMCPRARVESSAYALNADNLDGVDSSGFLNTSASAQTKSGPLTVDADARITGQLRIDGGNPAVGRVLTSDASGVASWQDPQPGPAGPVGPTGPAGPPGPSGVSGRPVYTSSSLDIGSVDGGTSITIGEDGLPIISYIRNLVLATAHCDDITCSSAFTTEHTGTSASGPYSTSIAIGSDGLPVIAMTELGFIRVVQCVDAVCSNVTVAEPQFRTTAVSATIAIGSDGLPLVAYQDLNGERLGVGHCEDLSCSGWTEAFIDPEPGFTLGSYPSIAIGLDGYPIISHLRTGPMSKQLVVTHCNDVTCSSADTYEVASGGTFTSIGIGVDGYPIIAHVLPDFLGSSSTLIRITHCLDEVCSASVTALGFDGVPSGDGTIEDLSLSVGTGGHPIVSYHRLYGSLTSISLAYCRDTGCSDVRLVELDSFSSFDHPSITIGTDGFPVVSYEDVSTLKVTHCSDRFCIPYQRAR